jgi:glycosyltransferase involved in cell wall biosynthesis
MTAPPTPAGLTDETSVTEPSAFRQSARPVRVCILAPSLDILGGQAVIAQRLIERLRQDPLLEISFIPHNPRLPGVLRNLQRIKYVRTIVTLSAYIGLMLRKFPRQDVIHVFSASYWSFLLAPTPAILIGRLLGKRVILNYRSGQLAAHLEKWPRTTMPVLKRVDQIVVPSAFLVEVFARFGLHAKSVFNFVEVDRITYRRRDALRPVFLSNRNFAALYNVGCVLRAFALIQKAVPEARLTVAGDGEQHDELHALARELGLRNVEFLGQVPPERMPALYDAADVYLNSPNIDNMPNSIIEAFAAGLPVVTTNAGGIPYIVTQEQTGLMVDCNDHQALAAAALRLLGDSELGLRMSTQARQEVLDRYTWSAVHRNWRRVYGIPDSIPLEAS